MIFIFYRNKIVVVMLIIGNLFFDIILKLGGIKIKVF